jgi:peptide/nickel transport system permease protein
MNPVDAFGHWWQADKVLLWTDGLLFAMVAACVAAILVAARSARLRLAWRRVFLNPAAAGSAVFLAGYLAVALFDSLHFHPSRGGPPGGEGSTAMISVLDELLSPLRTQTEESYSRPLAIHALNTKSVTLPDGTQGRTLPRLRHGGAQLPAPEAHRADVRRRITLAMLETIGASGLVCLGAIVVIAHDRRQPVAAATRYLLRDPAAIGWRSALIAVMCVILASALVMTLAPHYHVLGTDKVGNDVLYLCLKSIRTGLVIGALTTLVALPVAIVFGIAAGYWRGRIDDIVQYLYTTLDSIPFVLLVAAMVLVMQAYMSANEELFNSVEQRSDVRLLLLCVVLGLTRWTDLCRLLRGETLKLRELDYVQAARALGVGWPRLLLRTIVPNVMHLVLITVVMQFSGLVLAEAVLSYIGIGVDPGMHSWGNMINAARLELAREPVIWWSLSAALAFMFVLVLAANLFADAVRDAFDPRSAAPGQR